MNGGSSFWYIYTNGESSISTRIPENEEQDETAKKTISAKFGELLNEEMNMNHWVEGGI
jgi:hypothetical protein